MAKKTSKELFEEWRGKKVLVDNNPAIVVGYDLQMPQTTMIIISTDGPIGWGAEGLNPKQEFIDPTIETPYKKFSACGEKNLKLAE